MASIDSNHQTLMALEPLLRLVLMLSFPEPCFLFFSFLGWGKENGYSSEMMINYFFLMI